MLLKTLLFPFSVLYGWIMHVRNTLYDRSIKPSASFNIPVISIGNLTVGGTGKSPMVEYLVRLLASEFNVATLSRGYGRKTKGFRVSGKDDNATTIGDEPYQFYKKFGDQIMVAVGEERALAISMMLQSNSEMQVVLMDDAFQHRKVRPSLNILLCDYNRPFYDDLILPAGRLRESKIGACRADVIVVTKCPQRISDSEVMKIESSIRKIASRPVFFSSVTYSSPVPFEHTNSSLTNSFILVTGIANAGPLVSYVQEHYKLIDHLSFGDHHSYSVRDLQKILEKVMKHPDVCVLTTEKDMVKLELEEFLPLLKQIPFFFIPITVQFLRDGNDFDAMILNHVEKGV